MAEAAPHVFEDVLMDAKKKEKVLEILHRSPSVLETMFHNGDLEVDKAGQRYFFGAIVTKKEYELVKEWINEEEHEPLR